MPHASRQPWRGLRNLRPQPCAGPGDAVRRPLRWRTAWSAVAAVGLRPCSGALIVLTFAFLNGLFVGGVLSVFAMAVGTAITVSVLATLAVTAKNWAVAYAGDGRIGNRVHATIEIGGAALVFVLGLLLLSASLRGVNQSPSPGAGSVLPRSQNTRKNAATNSTREDRRRRRWKSCRRADMIVGR